MHDTTAVTLAAAADDASVKLQIQQSRVKFGVLRTENLDWSIVRLVLALHA